MEEKIRELFGVVLREPAVNISDDTRPATLEKWDSLQHLILVSSVEEEFGVDIDPDEIVDMFENFGAFKEIVLKKIRNAQ